MRSLFHIVAADDWAAVQEHGEYRAPSLADEGFVHCSYDAQVAATLRRHYCTADGQVVVDGLLVVELDPMRIAAPILVEDSYRSGSAFPHVYGPIPTTAVIAVHPTSRWLSDAADPGAAASPDQ